MWRLTERMVRSGLVMAWRFATSPTSTSPFFENATTDGVVREPSAFAMTVGSPPSRTLTTELVVPRSIPTAFAMWISVSHGVPPGMHADGFGVLGVSIARFTGAEGLRTEATAPYSHPTTKLESDRRNQDRAAELAPDLGSGGDDLGVGSTVGHAPTVGRRRQPIPR